MKRGLRAAKTVLAIMGLSLTIQSPPSIGAQSIFEEIKQSQQEDVSKILDSKEEFQTQIQEKYDTVQQYREELQQYTLTHKPAQLLEGVSVQYDDSHIGRLFKEWGYTTQTESRVAVVFTDEQGYIGSGMIPDSSQLTSLYIVNPYGQTEWSEEARQQLTSESIYYVYVTPDAQRDSQSVIADVESLYKRIQQSVEEAQYIQTTVQLPFNQVPTVGAFTTYPVDPNTNYVTYWYNDPAYLQLIGRPHTGMDISPSAGQSDIYSVMDGVVEEVLGRCSVGDRNCGGGWGNYVRIRHTNGLSSLSAHLGQVYVTPGQSVQAGQVIGLMGTTGRSDGVHLHFEVWYNGQKIDPYPYFNWNVFHQLHANPKYR